MKARQEIVFIDKSILGLEILESHCFVGRVEMNSVEAKGNSKKMKGTSRANKYDLINRFCFLLNCFLFHLLISNEKQPSCLHDDTWGRKGLDHFLEGRKSPF